MWGDILNFKVLLELSRPKQKLSLIVQKIGTKTIGPCLNGPGQKKLNNRHDPPSDQMVHISWHSNSRVERSLNEK